MGRRSRNDVVDLLRLMCFGLGELADTVDEDEVRLIVLATMADVLDRLGELGE